VSAKNYENLLTVDKVITIIKGLQMLAHPKYCVFLLGQYDAREMQRARVSVVAVRSLSVFD